MLACSCAYQLAAAGIRPKLRTVLADSGYVTEDNFARADYKLRAQTVEPVFGRIKTCQKMTTMSRRGSPHAKANG